MHSSSGNSSTGATALTVDKTWFLFNPHVFHFLNGLSPFLLLYFLVHLATFSVLSVIIIRKGCFLLSFTWHHCTSDQKSHLHTFCEASQCLQAPILFTYTASFLSYLMKCYHPTGFCIPSVLNTAHKLLNLSLSIAIILQNYLEHDLTLCFILKLSDNTLLAIPHGVINTSGVRTEGKNKRPKDFEYSQSAPRALEMLGLACCIRAGN